MNSNGYLLDTHIFLWYISKDNRLTESYKAVIENGENRVFLSVASVWECVIKESIHKINFPEAASIYVPKQRELHLIDTLGFSESTLRFLQELPNHHKDPFDRLLISQTLEQNLVLLTDDSKIKQYNVPIL